MGNQSVSFPFMSIYAFERQICGAASLQSSCPEWLTFLSLIIGLFFSILFIKLIKIKFLKNKK